MTFDATLPAIFYEILEKEGWEAGSVNTNETLTYTINAFTGLGCEITAETEGVFYAEIITCELLGNFQLKIVYDEQEITDILGVFIEFQQIDWKKFHRKMIEPFFAKLSSFPKSKAYFCKYSESKDVQNKVVIACHEFEVNDLNIQKILNPKFKEVAEFSFYLAGVLESQIVILKENIEAAWAKWQISLEIARNYDTLDEFVQEMTFEKPTYNELGNIMNFPQGGDIWIYPELEQIAEFIQSGSYFIIQDDGYKLHKVEYENGKVIYSSEIL